MQELPDLEDFTNFLNSGNLVLLRARISEKHLFRSKLERFSDRVYYFPFGVQPNLEKPVMIFANGMVMDASEFSLHIVGPESLQVVAVVFQEGLTEECSAQASFENLLPS